MRGVCPSRDAPSLQIKFEGHSRLPWIYTRGVDSAYRRTERRIGIRPRADEQRAEESLALDCLFLKETDASVGARAQ